MARERPEGENWYTSVELQKMDDLIVETQVSLEIPWDYSISLFIHIQNRSW